MMHINGAPPKRVLHSWKEIANYTGRGVRTVQRYELQYGFPVRRPAGGPRSAVLALCGEIDEWLAESPKRPGLPVQNHAGKRGDAVSVSLCQKITSTHQRAEAVRQCAESMAKRLQAAEMLCRKINQTFQHTLELQKKISVIAPSIMNRRGSCAISRPHSLAS